MNTAGANALKVQTAPRSRRWGILSMIPLVSFLIVVSVLSSTWRKSLKVEKLVLEGLHALSTNTIASATNIPLNSLMATIDLSDVQERLARQPYVKSVSVCREFPDRICITIKEREPIALLNAGGLYYLDAEGVVLSANANQREFDVPLISGIHISQQVEIGKVLANAEALEAIRLYQIAQSIDTSVAHMISEIHMNNAGDIILYAAEGGVPILLGAGNYGRKLVMLESFWSEFMHRGEEMNIRYIDLRFEDQVVLKYNGADAAPPRKLSL